MRKFKLDNLRVVTVAKLGYSVKRFAGEDPLARSIRLNLWDVESRTELYFPRILRADIESRPKNKGFMKFEFQFDQDENIRESDAEYKPAVAKRLNMLKAHVFADSYTPPSGELSHHWSVKKLGSGLSYDIFVLDVKLFVSTWERETFIEAATRIYSWYVDRLGVRDKKSLRLNSHEQKSYVMVKKPGTKKWVKVEVHKHLLDLLGF